MTIIPRVSRDPFTSRFLSDIVIRTSSTPRPIGMPLNENFHPLPKEYYLPNCKEKPTRLFDEYDSIIRSPSRAGSLVI